MNTPSLSAQILALEGPDAIAFAHGQFSSKVSELAVGQWQFGAWLDARGRVLALFHLMRPDENRLCLLLRGGLAEDMAQALRRYVFRSKVRIEVQAPRYLRRTEAVPLHHLAREGDHLVLGCGNHGMCIDTDPAHAGDHWLDDQLDAGWPWLPDACLGQMLPAWLSLHRLQAVAVDKGCYPGQEIVARMHFKGGNKRHLHRVALASPAASGDILRVDGREAGQLLEVRRHDNRTEALAVLPDDITGMTPLPAFDGGRQVRIVAGWPD